MENINIEFTVKVDSSIYKETECNTVSSFLNQFVFSHIGSECNFIESMVNSMQYHQRKEYFGYVETLKNMQESILSSIQYEIISQKDNIEEIKVKFNFNYYESPAFSLMDIIEIEIFNNQIKNSYGKSEDMINLMNIKNQDDKEKSKFIIKLYKHIGDMLKEAKENVLINQNFLEENKELN